MAADISIHDDLLAELQAELGDDGETPSALGNGL